MTILFAGGEMGAFVPSDSGAVEDGATSFNSAFARTSLRAIGEATFNDSAAFTETADIWLHFDLIEFGSSAGTSTKAGLMVGLDGSDNEVCRLAADYQSSGGTITWQLQYNLSGVWTALGSSFTTTASRQTFDIHFVLDNASGAGTVYVSGTQRSTGTADLSAIPGIAKLREYGITPFGAAETAVSQVVASTTSTIGGRLFTVPVNGAGASTDWTGTFAEIDEATYNDADFINSLTANQVSTFTASAPSLTGYQVQAVVVTARANCGATGPQNLQLALRSSGTNYFSSSKALDAGFGAFVNIWETDPATSAAFTNTAISSLQPGVKSIT